MDRSKVIFGNKMPSAVDKKAERSKQSFIRRFGDDSEENYGVRIEDNTHIGATLGVKNIQILTSEKLAEEKEDSANGDAADFDLERGLIVGNIRMGFGHYRISMAIASCANAMGYVPYWLDLNSYPETTCTKVISSQNDLYSLGSRISQKSSLFNKYVWEPINYEGFRQLSYNAADQKNAELMAPVFKNIPKSIPVVATHVWPAQAALHAGMTKVVNAIPDNWPMALHLAEGSIHTVQTHYAYQGYRILNGFDKEEILTPMPEDSLLYTGHYVDDELVRNIEIDCERRMSRKLSGEPMRFLLTIGGAGAQGEIFKAIIEKLMPLIRSKRVALYVNVGDYKAVWEKLLKEIPGLRKVSREHFDNWEETTRFTTEALTKRVVGVHAFYHSNIFEAVYATNLLMRSADVLVTKPSELSFYPIPKLFIKRVGGHEQWGAVHSAEIGDGTLECRDVAHTLQMLDLFINDNVTLRDMCNNILKNKMLGIYNGGYEVVKIAMKQKEMNQEKMMQN